MFEAIQNTKIASFKLDGKKIEIVPAAMVKSANSYSMKVDGLLIVADFETTAEDFYRWTVKLINRGSENTAQITEFYGMDLDVPVAGSVMWESIHGDSCNGQSFLPLKACLSE